jgi:phenylalanyl-tRNA synthetase alpha chain
VVDQAVALRERIATTRDTALAQLQAVTDREALEAWRVRWVGRKGKLSALFVALSGFDSHERPELGRALNTLKSTLHQRLQQVETHLRGDSGGGPEVDASLTGRPRWVGSHHIARRVLEEMLAIFEGLGFSIATGPEVELERYNFEALNFPPNHPARDLQDTFWVDDRVLLRTQTSPMQVRIMRSQPPPVRIVVPGRVYRNEQIDASHAAEFFQLEGLYVDRNVSMIDLKATVSHFVQRLFGSGRSVRFKPHFFPFTEPSVDVDMTCFSCQGHGCRVCGNEGWIEIMGAGMVHPNVFEACGYDPEEVTGFAFGMGIERISMLRHGINDIRLFLENDVRFLSQF